MRILLVHNFYQLPGGEDQVFADESRLLQAHGHDVHPLTMHNDTVERMGKLRLACTTLWNTRAYRRLRAEIRAHHPDIVHFHNVFPLVSPSAYYAARAARVPVVQTLHNYRLLCPGATLFRDQRCCQDCVGRPIPWPAVVHRCYRGSAAASAMTAGMIALHRGAGTWSHAVDVYVALTPFARRKFIEGGLPAHKIEVKPNFVDPDPGYLPGHAGYALFVGRFSPEKGIETLLEAWRRLGLEIPLKIAGDGPCAATVRKATDEIAGVEWLGWRPAAEVRALLRGAAFLVFPSAWYEGLPKTIIESFAVGTPVLASKIGSLDGLITHRRTGLHVRAGDPDDLANLARWAWTHPGEMADMGVRGRQEYEAKYTASANYDQIMAIYDRAATAARTR